MGSHKDSYSKNGRSDSNHSSSSERRRRSRSRSPRRHSSRSSENNRRTDHHKRERSPHSNKHEQPKKLKTPGNETHSRRDVATKPITVVQEVKEDTEKFQQKVEEQLKQLEGPSEEEIIEQARRRRLEILQKYKKNETQTQQPQSDNSDKSDVSPLREKSPEIDLFQADNSSPASINHQVVSPSHNEASVDIFGDSPVDSVNPPTFVGEIQSDDHGYVMVRVGEVLGNRYVVTGVCGKGMFSRAVRARDTESTDPETEVVIKVIRDNEFMKRVGTKEIDVLTRLNESDPESKYHCIKFISHFRDRDLLCLVFESMKCNLRELINKYGKGGLHIRAVQIFSKHLLLSLHYLKKLELCHADFKPDNIFVNHKSNSVKLGDFGSVVTLSEALNEMRTHYLVTGFYRAPEVILGLPFDYSVDMWSLGCTIFEMATGSILFKGCTNNNELLKAQMDICGEIPKKLIKRGVFRDQHFDENFNFLMKKVDPITSNTYIQPIVITKPSRDLKEELLKTSADSNGDKHIYTALYDLIHKMLLVNPNQRIKPEEALTHPFFNL